MKTELEEASKKYAHNYFDMHETNNYKSLLNGFIEGAKWQEKNSDKKYSEEEVIYLLSEREINLNLFNSIFDYQYTKEWFEQFKKK